MPKTIAVFGAGPGLGLSVARRFGREGYRVALVARSRKSLDAMAEQLHAEGVTTDTFDADLSLTGGIASLIDRINARFGHIDVLEFAPIYPSPFLPAAELNADRFASDH